MTFQTTWAKYIIDNSVKKWYPEGYTPGAETGFIPGEIGREIGDVLIQTNSTLLEELNEDIVNGDGTIDEIAEVKSITFYDSWNEIILLEGLGENIEFM